MSADAVRAVFDAWNSRDIDRAITHIADLSFAPLHIGTASASPRSMQQTD